MIRLLRYLWTLPTTCIGAIFIPLCLVTGGRVRIVRGVIEVCGGVVSVLLRRCVPIPGGASAMTLGHVVIARDQACLDLSREHERIHVRQAERWGPFFIPAYLIASILVKLRGGDAYMDNPFEREAYGKAPVRGGNS
jgi:hypothetical protein